MPPVVQQAGVPVVVLNLQPEAALDYAAFNALGDRGLMTGAAGELLGLPAPEIACVFNRAGIDYHLVTGTLDDPEAGIGVADAAGVTACGNRVGARPLRRHAVYSG